MKEQMLHRRKTHNLSHGLQSMSKCEFALCNMLSQNFNGLKFPMGPKVKLICTIYLRFGR